MSATNNTSRDEIQSDHGPIGTMDQVSNDGKDTGQPLKRKLGIQGASGKASKRPNVPGKDKVQGKRDNNGGVGSSVAILGAPNTKTKRRKSDKKNVMAPGGHVESKESKLQRKQNVKLLELLEQHESWMKQRETQVRKLQESRKEFLYPIPAQKEPLRAKSHWDSLLEEMMWMATDFIEERKYKQCVATRLAYSAKSVHHRKEEVKVKGQRALEGIHRGLMSRISREMSKFWDSKLMQIGSKWRRMRFAMDTIILPSDDDKHGAEEILLHLGEQPLESTLPKNLSVQGECDRIDEDSFNHRKSKVGKMFPPGKDQVAGWTSIWANLTDGDQPMGHDEREGDDDDDDATYEPSPEELEGGVDSESTIAEQERYAQQGDFPMTSEVALLKQDQVLDVEQVVQDIASKSHQSSYALERHKHEAEELEPQGDDDDDADADFHGDSADEDDEDRADGEGIRGLDGDNIPSMPVKVLNQTIKSYATSAEEAMAACDKDSENIKVWALPRLLNEAQTFSFKAPQEFALRWLAKMHITKQGAVLADERRFGRERSLIAFLGSLAGEKGLWGPHLVVTDRPLPWEIECKSLCPSLRVSRGVHGFYDGNIVLLTTEECQAHAKEITRHRWSYLVWDLISSNVMQDPDNFLDTIPFGRFTNRVALCFDEASAREHATMLLFFLLPYVFDGSYTNAKDWSKKKTNRTWEDCVEKFTLARSAAAVVEEVEGEQEQERDTEIESSICEYVMNVNQKAISKVLIEKFHEKEKEKEEQPVNRTPTRSGGRRSTGGRNNKKGENIDTAVMIAIERIGYHPELMFPRIARSSFVMDAVLSSYVLWNQPRYTKFVEEAEFRASYMFRDLFFEKQMEAMTIMTMMKSKSRPKGNTTKAERQKLDDIVGKEPLGVLSNLIVAKATAFTSWGGTGAFAECELNPSARSILFPSRASSALVEKLVEKILALQCNVETPRERIVVLGHDKDLVHLVGRDLGRKKMTYINLDCDEMEAVVIGLYRLQMTDGSCVILSTVEDFATILESQTFFNVEQAFGKLDSMIVLDRDIDTSNQKGDVTVDTLAEMIAVMRDPAQPKFHLIQMKFDSLAATKDETNDEVIPLFKPLDLPQLKAALRPQRKTSAKDILDFVHGNISKLLGRDVLASSNEEEGEVDDGQTEQEKLAPMIQTRRSITVLSCNDVDPLGRTVTKKQPFSYNVAGDDAFDHNIGDEEEDETVAFANCEEGGNTDQFVFRKRDLYFGNGDDDDDDSSDSSDDEDFLSRNELLSQSQGSQSTFEKSSLSRSVLEDTSKRKRKRVPCGKVAHLSHDDPSLSKDYFGIGSVAGFAKRFITGVDGSELLVIDTKRIPIVYQDRNKENGSNFITDQDNIDTEALRLEKIRVLEQRWIRETTEKEPIVYASEVENKENSFRNTLEDLKRTGGCVESSFHVYGPPIPEDEDNVSYITSPPAVQTPSDLSLHQPQSQRLVINFMKRRTIVVMNDSAAKGKLGVSNKQKGKKGNKKKDRIPIPSSSSSGGHVSASHQDSSNNSSTNNNNSANNNVDLFGAEDEETNEDPSKEVDWLVQVPRVRYRLNKGSKKDRSADEDDEWAPWEDAAILRSVELYGPNWAFIARTLLARAFGSVRSAIQVQDRYVRIRSSYRTSMDTPYMKEKQNPKDTKNIAPWASPPLHKSDLLLNVPPKPIGKPPHLDVSNSDTRANVLAKENKFPKALILPVQNSVEEDRGNIFKIMKTSNRSATLANVLPLQTINPTGQRTVHPSQSVPVPSWSTHGPGGVFGEFPATQQQQQQQQQQQRGSASGGVNPVGRIPSSSSSRSSTSVSASSNKFKHQQPAQARGPVRSPGQAPSSSTQAYPQYQQYPQRQQPSQHVHKYPQQQYPSQQPTYSQYPSAGPPSVYPSAAGYPPSSHPTQYQGQPTTRPTHSPTNTQETSPRYVAKPVPAQYPTSYSTGAPQQQPYGYGQPPTSQQQPPLQQPPTTDDQAQYYQTQSNLQQQPPPNK